MRLLSSVLGAICKVLAGLLCVCLLDARTRERIALYARDKRTLATDLNCQTPYQHTDKECGMSGIRKWGVINQA